MEIKVGIVGLPNVGKSTLFNAITNLEIEAANYPFATIEPNIGSINIIDSRVDILSNIYQSKKVIYNQLKFYDIAGLVKGASKGEGLGNKFLNNIREVDSIVHVVRLFDDSDIVHVDGKINPINDIETVNTELIISDIEQVNRWLEKNEKKIITSGKGKDNLNLMKKIYKNLSEEQEISKLDLSKEEKEFLKNFQFLTIKPTIYLLNVSESDLKNIENNKYYNEVKRYVENKLKSKILIISSKIEFEISKLELEDQQIFLQELNLEKSGLNLISKEVFDILDLGTFFTAGKEEIHAWPFKKGTLAPQAAGIIHSDFEKGFIKAEVFKFSDIEKYKSEQKLSENNLIKLEGKNYQIKDGDICHFRFNI